jgi:hypothetical protein
VYLCDDCSTLTLGCGDGQVECTGKAEPGAGDSKGARSAKTLKIVTCELR